MSQTFIDNEIEISKEDKDTKEKFSENKVEDVPINTEDKTDINNEENQEWIDLLGSGAIMKKIIINGQADKRPQRLEKCIINYTCLLEDETIVESASYFELNLGESDVIQGLDVSVGLMNLHEKCRLKIEPRLAFGAKGLPPKIPGNVSVIYDVELVAIEPEYEIESLSVDQRKHIGNKKRERGNWWYIRGENNLAIQCYRRALDYLDEVEGGITGPLSDGPKNDITDADLQSLLEDRISVCNNMAAAQIKMEMYDAALSSLQIVLNCQPDNVKAHFRRAKAYIGKNDLPKAMKCLLKAKELVPNEAEIQKEINAVSKIISKQKHSERELARRMFNGPKRDISHHNELKKNDGKMRVGLWATLGATLIAGVAGLVAYRFKYA